MRRLFFTLLFAAALIAPASAIDFKAPIRNVDGSPVPLSATDQSPLTLGKICEDALIANNLPGDSPTTDEKNKRFWLALKVHDGKVALNADEISMLKKVIGLAYGPLVIGRTTEMLDPASVPK